MGRLTRRDVKLYKYAAGSGPYSETSRGGERSWLCAFGAATGVSGLAWADDATVPVAWFRLPQAADRVYDLLQLLRVSTVSG